MKQTAIEWLLEVVGKKGLVGLFTREELNQFEEIEKQQQGYSEEEVLEFTQTIIQQYKFGNTNIEQLDLLKETLQLFTRKSSFVQAPKFSLSSLESGEKHFDWSGRSRF